MGWGYRFWAGGSGVGGVGGRGDGGEGSAGDAVVEVYLCLQVHVGVALRKHGRGVCDACEE